MTHYLEEEYMTKEEIIEVFYSNYDAFCEVAEYLLPKTGYTGMELSQDGDKIILSKNGPTGMRETDTVELGTVEIGAQIKLICDFGFEGVGRDKDGTRIYFSMRYFDPPADIGLPCSRGIIYVPEGLGNARPEDILKKDNWYYFFLRFE
jgi:hypothetical protein